jgi:hypothetical protein
LAYAQKQLRSPFPTITLDDTVYEIDAFGMDDRRDAAPDEAYRFLFQLGIGTDIFVYVIQAGAPGDDVHVAHDLELVDSAVAEIEPESRPTPERVRVSAKLPNPFKTARLAGVGADRSATITAVRVDAIPGGPVQFSFSTAGAFKGARWRWGEGWTVQDPEWRPVAAGEALSFG